MADIPTVTNSHDVHRLRGFVDAKNDPILAPAR
jgi:hypothetical protein